MGTLLSSEQEVQSEGVAPRGMTLARLRPLAFSKNSYSMRTYPPMTREPPFHLSMITSITHHPPPAHPSACLSVHVFTHQFTHTPVYPPAYPPARPSARPSVRPPIKPPF